MEGAVDRHIRIVGSGVEGSHGHAKVEVGVDVGTEIVRRPEVLPAQAPVDGQALSDSPVIRELA